MRLNLHSIVNTAEYSPWQVFYGSNRLSTSTRRVRAKGHTARTRKKTSCFTDRVITLLLHLRYSVHCLSMSTKPYSAMARSSCRRWGMGHDFEPKPRLHSTFVHRTKMQGTRHQQQQEQQSRRSHVG